MYLERVAIVGLFDEKWPHQRIAALGVHVRMLDVLDAFPVGSAGVPRPRDNSVARVNPGDRFLECREHPRVMLGIDFVRRSHRKGGEQSKMDHGRYDTTTYPNTRYSRVDETRIFVC